MITDLNQFKTDRNEAIASRDIKTIRLFASKYSIKLPYSDEEVLKLISQSAKWD